MDRVFNLTKIIWPKLQVRHFRLVCGKLDLCVNNLDLYVENPDLCVENLEKSVEKS